MAAARGNPRILAFVCSWHPLAAADNAGADRRSYGTATAIVPVDCAGVVSAAAIIRAFSSAVDGVLIAACGRGDCHYSNGNESCEKVVEETRDLMKLAGVAPQRLRLDLSSDVDGGQFVALLNEFAGELAGLNERGGRKRRTPSKAKAAAGKKPAKAKAAAGKKAAKTKRVTAKKTSARKQTSRKKTSQKTSTAGGKKAATRVKKKVAPKKSAARAKRKR